MAEQPGQRPRWRDALVLTVLAVVLVGGLIHYGRGLDEEDDPSRSAVQAPSDSASPTADATAELESGPSADPSSPPPAPKGTCWDGRETTSLRLCGLPEGARGLEWVFPSFARDRGEGHQATPNAVS
jgi:hypothetical protein